MAASTTGISNVTWGVPTKTGYVVSSYSKNTAPLINAVVEDENGTVVHRRLDDRETTLSLAVIVTTGSLPAIGDSFIYDSVTYIVTSVNVERANKDFQRATIEGVKNEYI